MGGEPERGRTAAAVSGVRVSHPDRVIDAASGFTKLDLTSVAAFSTRARPGLPVSVPLAWEELDARAPPAHSAASVPRRLAAEGRDPWSAYPRTRQRLEAAVLQAVGATPGGEAKRPRAGSGR
jgi:DNA primase